MTKKIIALVGRPNVGKSTLFNRLSFRVKAIIHDKPGVTRDRKYADAAIGSFEFTVVDTPGLFVDGKIEEKMMDQTMLAILEADLVCFIVDGRAGLTADDQVYADLVRKNNKNSIIVVNKCEKEFYPNHEYYKLGFDEPIAISAEHGIGLADLYDKIAETIDTSDVEIVKIQDQINIVIAGRPNVGKSTFINKIVGKNRLLAGPEAGLTRESIELDFIHKNQAMKIIDTAGLRKKNNVNSSLERLSTTNTIENINFANVVILMIDALQPLEHQDLTIINYVEKEGRALVIVINKWDLIKDKQAFQSEFAYQSDKYLSQIKNVSCIYVSALSGNGIYDVLDESVKTYEIWNKKISTNKLNNWLIKALLEHNLPLFGAGNKVRIKYITQTKTRPPTFKLFSNNPGLIPDSYKRYLINDMREKLDLPGVPIRFIFDKSDNPYNK